MVFSFVAGGIDAIVVQPFRHRTVVTPPAEPNGDLLNPDGHVDSRVRHGNRMIMQCWKSSKCERQVIVSAMI